MNFLKSHTTGGNNFPSIKQKNCQQIHVFFFGGFLREVDLRMFPSKLQHFTGVFLYPETVISTLLTNPRPRKQMLHLSPRPPSKLVQVRNSIGAMKNTLLFKVSRDYSTQFYGDYNRALIRIPINQSVWKVISFFLWLI